MQSRSEINTIRPAGNAELKNSILALITQGDAATIKHAFEELDGHEDNLLPSDKNELILAAQKRNSHAIVVFLKNHFKMPIYLGIPPEPFGEAKRLLIGQEPLNTTGDFYHLLAFIALSISLGYDVPKLACTYEETQDEGTKLAYSRDLALLNILGLGNLIEEDINAKIAHLGRSSSNSRRLALRESIKAGGFHLLDQKATTAILAEQCSLFGLEKISAMIRPILSRLPQDLPNNVKQYIYRFGVTQRKSIKHSPKPYVVMHLRFAGKSKKPGYNEQQDLQPRFIIDVANYLQEKGRVVLFVHSTSRAAVDCCYHLIQTLDIINNNKALNPFIPEDKLYSSQFGEYGLPDYLSDLAQPIGTPTPWQTVDIGKVLHLQFFLKLYKLSKQLEPSNRPIKVIGNTSGTTDAVAFIGHNVLNIHHFNSEHIGQIDYQNYRILMQLAFMSVIEQSNLRNVKPDIEQWLVGKHICPNTEKFDTNNISELLEHKGKIVMDFAILCCVLGWPERKRSNTNVTDGASAELINSAIHCFETVKARFQESRVTNSVTTFKPLPSEIEEDILVDTFIGMRLSLGST